MRIKCKDGITGFMKRMTWKRWSGYGSRGEVGRWRRRRRVKGKQISELTCSSYKEIGVGTNQKPRIMLSGSMRSRIRG